MAKKRRIKPALFFEALPAAPQLPHAVVFDTERTKHLKRLGLLASRQLYNDTIALAHDIGLFVAIILRMLGGQTMRTIALFALSGMAIAGTIVAVRIGTAALSEHGPSLASPAVIMGMKNTGTTILDKNGVVLYKGYGAVDRRSIPLFEMPPSVVQATLAAEDPDFYKHPGVSWRSVARAAYRNASENGKIQGGSTITQQLVKNTLLTSERSFTRKYKEMVLSMAMERRYTKDQILEMYLNTIYYGQGAYGIQTAAQTYFHKPARELTLGESALLAGLPQSPSRFDPNINEEGAKKRRDYVLSRMQELGYAENVAVSAAKLQPIDAGSHQVVLKAPHFVFYVLQQLRREYGEKTVKEGGITVTTTLDYIKQQEAELIVKKQITKLVAHNSTNGALVSLNPKTGDIISMVGSVDYNAPGFGNVNVTLSELQPGSSFKPIAYAVAFSKGWNGATVVDDKPVRFPQPSGEVFAPQNYDLKFRGQVLLRRALANSFNIPAIEVLQHGGLEATLAMAHNLGIRPPSLTETNRYGLSLVLGGGEVRPIDMAAVYATFANGGKNVAPQAILEVKDRAGNSITKPRTVPTRQAIDPRIAFMITNILSDTEARKEEFGARNPLQLSRPAAAKTGTTNDFRDNWTIGYTPQLATAVWVGNNDHSPMLNVDGITGAAPIWHDYMEMALADSPVEQFTPPSGLAFTKVCPIDGGLAAPNDPSAIEEVFLVENQPTKRCGQIRPPAVLVQAVTPQNPTPPTPGSPSEAPPLLPPEPGRGGGGDDGDRGTPTPDPNQQPVSPPPSTFPFKKQ
ncbi:MAG TPA: PBP1A family penicillin-binding protein [Candidatus Saccharimonadia bacterium]